MPDGNPAADLNNMSKSELKALQRQVEKALAQADTRRKQVAVAAVEAAIKEFGLTLNELLPEISSSKRKGSKASAPVQAQGEPKYRNPDNAQETWSGRGRRPGWVNAALSAGKTLEELGA